MEASVTVRGTDKPIDRLHERGLLNLAAVVIFPAAAARLAEIDVIVNGLLFHEGQNKRRPAVEVVVVAPSLRIPDACIVNLTGWKHPLSGEVIVNGQTHLLEIALTL